jgi:hypothetical protein
MKFEPLSKREEDIAKIIVDAACCVHKDVCKYAAVKIPPP